MQHGEVCARGRRDDGDAVHLLAVRPHPGFRQRRQADRAFAAAIDEVGPPAAAGILPFVIAVGRDQAAPPLDRVLEGGLVQHRLGTGIDQQRELAGVLDPGRHQAPAHQLEMPLAVFQNHHWNRLRRSDVIPRREIGLFGVAEYLPHRRRRGCDYEASAHSATKTSTCSGPINRKR